MKHMAAFLLGVIVTATGCQLLVAPDGGVTPEATEITLAYIEYKDAEGDARDVARERLRRAIIDAVAVAVGSEVDIESVTPTPATLMLVAAVFEDEPEERILYFAQVLTVVLEAAAPSGD